jgi:hypothetical protein
MLRAEPPRPKSSHFPLLVRFGFAGRWVLSRPRRFWARRRAVLTGPTSPRTIAVGGMGAGPTAEPNRFGILWFIARRQPLSAWLVVFASRPASIRTCPSPQARCQMGSLVLVGRCYLCGDLDWIKTLNAVCPIATVMLYFDASHCSHSSPMLQLNSILRLQSLHRPLRPPSPAYCSAAVHILRR